MITVDEFADFSHRLISQGMALAQRVKEMEKEIAAFKEEIAKKASKKEASNG